MVTKYANGQLSKWDEYLDQAVFACRIRTHLATRKSPFYLVYGCQPRIPGDLTQPKLTDPLEDELTLNQEARIRKLNAVRAEAQQNIRSQGSKMKERYDATVPIENLKVGDFVLIRNNTKKKFEPLWVGPYKIIRTCPLQTYQLEHKDESIKEDLVYRDRHKLARVDELNSNKSWYSKTQNVGEPTII